MSRFSTGGRLLWHVFFWGLLSLSACDSSKGSRRTGESSGGTSSLPGGGSGGFPDGGESCGNGRMDPGESCDDGNDSAGDGCAADCESIETGFACPIPDEDCVPLHVCGDRAISGAENCDDGNALSLDGCSSTCLVEAGYACPVVGVRCQAAACGDGIIAGQESCDDGQTSPTNGDGCSATCVLETPTDAQRDGWVCRTPGASCQRTTCGDGLREGSEQCDDGNNDMGDRCSPFCRSEPDCPAEGGPCSTACGDGLLLPSDAATGQECDDGNTVAGDGCSAECRNEAGYSCAPEPLVRESLTLPLVLRDFTPVNASELGTAHGHPDFQYDLGGWETGIVQEHLGLNGKPIHSTENKSTTSNEYVGQVLQGTDWFAYWYSDAPLYNQTFSQTLQLTKLATGALQYSSDEPKPPDTSVGFFPVDGLGWGDEYAGFDNELHNFHFTSEVRYWFAYTGNELLEFMGDDDVWVFVNKRLAVDLGGIHTRVYGSVELDPTSGYGTICSGPASQCAAPKDFGLVLDQVYEIVVFQAERHTDESNYLLTLGNFVASRSICRSECGDGIVTPDEACDLGREGNTDQYGTCTVDCRLPAYCGDGQLDENEGEGCDDGANLAVYGYNKTLACNPNCQLAPYCGDGQLDDLFGEECDDGNDVSDDGCEANCTRRIGCGNDEVDSGEECDDGNTLSGDGCSEFCTVETPILT